jgi:hypothetical protein
MFDKIIKPNLTEQDKINILKPHSNEIRRSTLVTKGYPSYFKDNTNQVGSHKGQMLEVVNALEMGNEDNTHKGSQGPVE